MVTELKPALQCQPPVPCGPLPPKIQLDRQPAVSETAAEQQGTRRRPLGAEVAQALNTGASGPVTPAETIATKFYLITKNPRGPLPPRHRSGHVTRPHSGRVWMAKWQGSQGVAETAVQRGAEMYYMRCIGRAVRLAAPSAHKPAGPEGCSY